MGKAKQGIYGPYSGRVGSVVGSVIKGTQVLRIRPSTVHNPNTEAQQDTRLRFALLGKFLASQRQAVNEGFKFFAQTMSAVNAAMRENFHSAFTGVFPDLAIDFSKVLISKGGLVLPEGFTATASAGATISLVWTNNSDKLEALEQDTLIVGLYDPELQRGEVFSGFYRRNEAAGVLNLPGSWVGRTVEVLAFFKSGNDPALIKPGYEVSDTVYGGQVTLLE